MTRLLCLMICFFFFNDTATTEIYTLSLHDALPISRRASRPASAPGPSGHRRCDCRPPTGRRARAPRPPIRPRAGREARAALVWRWRGRGGGARAAPPPPPGGGGGGPPAPRAPPPWAAPR